MVPQSSGQDALCTWKCTYRVAICTRDHLLARGIAAMLAPGVSLQDLLPKPQASSAAQAHLQMIWAST